MLDSREIQSDGVIIPQVLVKWETLPSHEATWIDTTKEGIAEPEQLGSEVAEERPRRRTAPPAWHRQFEVSGRKTSKGKKKGG